MSIKPEQLAQTIIKTLEEYQGVTEEAAASAAIEAANSAVTKLQGAAPSGAGAWGSWDKYNSSWAATDLAKRKNVYGKVVHNQKYYQLTHLLENGHVIVNKKGEYGRTRPIKHIEPAEQEGIQNFEQLVRAELEGIS